MTSPCAAGTAAHPDKPARNSSTRRNSKAANHLDRLAGSKALVYRRARTISVIGTFGVLLLACLYIAQSLLVPVIMAFLLSLVFSPVVRSLLVLRIPRGISALAIVLALSATVIAGIYGLSGPVSGWIDEAPNIERQLRLRLADLSEPLDKLREAQQQVSEATDQNNDAEDVQKVVVTEPNLISQAAQGAPDLLAGIAMMAVLLLFILSAGDQVYEKLVRALPTFGDRRKGLRIAHDVEREVSRYLATISAINIILGIVIGCVMALIGMPNPVLWGILAAVLNYVPILGALTGIAIVAVVGLVSMQTTSEALLAPALYFACTALEGQIITPALVGNRLRINSIAIVLAVAFWGWMWGPVGILVAVPLLIVTRVIANHVDGLGGLRELLGPHAVGNGNRLPIRRSQ
jgi:predicted PurR-regulated permease PerM